MTDRRSMVDRSVELMQTVPRPRGRRTKPPDVATLPSRQQATAAEVAVVSKISIWQRVTLFSRRVF